jgi:hypothetical protein
MALRAWARNNDGFDDGFDSGFDEGFAAACDTQPCGTTRARPKRRRNMRHRSLSWIMTMYGPPEDTQ